MARSKEAHQSARFGFKIVAVLQAFGDQERMTERDIGTHDQHGGFARVDRLEFAGLDAVAQDQLDRRAHDFLVRHDGVPALLHRDHDDVINLLIFQKIFLVIGEHFEQQPLQPFARRAARARDRPHLVFELAKAALADGLHDRDFGREKAVDIGRRHAEFRGDVGDRGFGIAKPAEQRFGGFHDPRAGIFGLELGLGVHRAICRCPDY